MLTEADLLERLRQRHAGDAWAFFPHVANGTGGRATRTADALAMGLWPSRGMEVHGFEIKCFRRDWQRELAQPQKAEEIVQYCDRWWIVAPPAVVQPNELPPTWGLIETHGAGLRVIIAAPKLEAAPLGRFFIAGLLRKASRIAYEESALAQAREAGFKDGAEVARKAAAETRQHVEGELIALRQRVAAFEEASGVHIGSWRPREIGAAVKIVLAAGVEATRLDISAETLERAVTDLRSAAAQLRGEAVAGIPPATNHTQR